MQESSERLCIHREDQNKLKNSWSVFSKTTTDCQQKKIKENFFLLGSFFSGFVAFL